MTTSDVARSVPPRPCPACGTAAHPQRELCPACGADLDSGERLPFPAQGPAAPARRSGVAAADRLHSALHHVRDRLVLAVLGVALTVTFVVGGLVVAGRGPFAPPAVLPAVGFDPARYPADPGVLLVREVGSVPPSEGEEALLDGTAETAWRAVRDPSGSVRLVLVLDEPAWIARVVMLNGDQSSSDAYERSGRARRILLVLDGDRRIGVDLLDVGRDRQVIALPNPELTTLVEIELVEAFDGVRADDIALSGIELLGWVADGDDRASAIVRAGDRVDGPTLGPAG